MTSEFLRDDARLLTLKRLGSVLLVSVRKQVVTPLGLLAFPSRQRGQLHQVPNVAHEGSLSLAVQGVQKNQNSRADRMYCSSARWVV